MLEMEERLDAPYASAKDICPAGRAEERKDEGSDSETPLPLIRGPAAEAVEP